MENPEPQAPAAPVPLAERWRRLRAAWQYANKASHHVLGFTVKLVLLVYFALALLFLALRYLILPNIDIYKGDIERLASRALGNQVTIDRIYASWNGLNPSLFLGDVTLTDRAGTKVLALPSVAATLSWWSVAAFEPRFDSLELIRPELDVRRGADGVIQLAGLRIDPRQQQAGGGADWVFRQHRILIREGRINWTDDQRQAPTLALRDVALLLKNKWNTHKVALQATPPAQLAQPLDVRANFRHPRFGGRAADMARWQGEIYLDLREADLAGWQRYVDYPFALQQGRGSLRAWITLDQARLAGFTADLALSGVTARLQPTLAPLALARVSGRLAARERFAPGQADGKPTFGSQGHTISLTDLTVVTANGHAFPAATLSETFTPAQGKQPQRLQLEVGQLDLALLAELAAQLPLSAAQRELLTGLAPRGQVSAFSAELDGPLAAPSQYRAKGRVAGLSLQPQPAWPGFDNLSGSVDLTQQGGAVELDSEQLTLRLPGWMPEPDMLLDSLALAARWRYQAGEQLSIDIDKLALAQGAFQASLSGRHVLPLTPGHGPGVADFTGSFGGFPVGQIGRYLPLATPPHLRDWLSHALQGGTLNDGHLRLRGDLAEFPFRGDQAASRARGEFRVGGRLQDVLFEYAPGHRHPDGKVLWPLAQKINGSIVFERERMDISADSMRSLGLDVSRVKAVIPDLAAHAMMLNIDGHIAGPLQDFLRYVGASPVLGWIGHFTEDTRARGNASLALKLQLALADLPTSRVNGSLQLQNNEVQLFPDLPALQRAQGKIEFNEHGVNLNGVGASFVGGPLSLSGGTRSDGAIVIDLAGTLSADGMRRNPAVAELGRLAARMQGSTPYRGAISVRDHHLNVVIDSTLVGLAIDLPAPLNKALDAALPLHVALSGALPVDGISRDELRLELKDAVYARYARSKRANGPWVVERGGIGVRTAAPEPDDGLMISADVNTLNMDDWIAAGRAIAGDAAPASQTVSGPNFSQYVTPTTVAVRAKELFIGQRRVADVVLGATHRDQVWQANLDSRQATGYLTWSEAQGQGMGKVTARLASLVIPESQVAEVQALLETARDDNASIPALDIVVERFELFNKPLGRLELQASNVPARAGKEWRIDALKLSNPDGELESTGRWLSKDGKNNTNMNFKLDIRDAGRLLDRLGFPDTLRRGKGTLTGDLSWSGLPYAFDIPSLSGQLNVDVKNGQFLKRDPGAAKLLGVLSLQALPRLLKLDFHDVFSEGLAFDGIGASAMITRGVVSTENLRMHGVAASVLMAGKADLAHESTDLHVVVIPEFNLGTGPLVYGLAVNPVIGLGSYLAQLFLRAPMMKAMTYQMRITGPWKAPVIIKLDNPSASLPAALAKESE